MSEFYYLQIVTSVNYMLSDLYIPVNTNPTSPELEDLTNVGEDSLASHVDSDDDSLSCSHEEKPTYSVDIHDLCLSHKKKNKSKSNCYCMENNIFNIRQKLIFSKHNIVSKKMLLPLL